MIIDIVHDAPVLGCETIDWGLWSDSLQFGIIPSWVWIIVDLMFALCLDNSNCMLFGFLLGFVEGRRRRTLNPMIYFRSFRVADRLARADLLDS